MKKLSRKINFAILAIMTSVPAFAAAENDKGLCDLLDKLKDVFNVLRILAFVGAAFYIASWAWDFISGGKAEMKTVKEKGTGLLVGFILLFAIGVVLSFVMSTAGSNLAGCAVDKLKSW